MIVLVSACDARASEAEYIPGRKSSCNRKDDNELLSNFIACLGDCLNLFFWPKKKARSWQRLFTIDGSFRIFTKKIYINILFYGSRRGKESIQLVFHFIVCPKTNIALKVSIVDIQGLKERSSSMYIRLYMAFCLHPSISSLIAQLPQTFKNRRHSFYSSYCAVNADIEQKTIFFL